MSGALMHDGCEVFPRNSGVENDRNGRRGRLKGRREIVSSLSAAVHGEAAAESRLGRPMDNAQAVGFMASDATAFVTGTPFAAMAV